MKDTIVGRGGGMVLHPLAVEHKMSGKVCVCEEQSKSFVLAPAVHVVNVQASPISVEEKESERDACGTLMLNSERWASESESEWLEIEVNFASSVTTTPGETVF